jgi:3-dehydroquinate dehydratase-1
MATRLQAYEPIPAMTKPNGVMKIEEIIHNEPPRLLVLFDEGQENILHVIADVVGQPFLTLTALEELENRQEDVVIGLSNQRVSNPEALHAAQRTIITTHCLDAGDLRDETTTSHCDYEYLYNQKPFLRRDLARFLGFVLGQIKPHDDLIKKRRTTLLSTTFPDLRTALPNLDILSVGADSVEIRVDLLKESDVNEATDGTSAGVPSLKYVGEQVMWLRQRTELPIIFTTRCTKENGRFPMDDPTLFYQYLRKAIQWGCEYIDVELWLPHDIRKRLSREKGNSKIISAFHDFTGKFKWTSPEAQALFKEGAVYGDIVKMIALITSNEENYELEYFRSITQSTYSHPPLSGLNMGPTGQLSRTLNKVFTPITHPLLPMIAAPGQLSAAEINSMLHSMGQMPGLDIYAIGNVRSDGQAMFFEKCLNELSLPHQLLCVEHAPSGSLESMLAKANFGGAFLNPPLPAMTASYIPTLSDAAIAIGQIDTVVARSKTTTGNPSLIGDNATWKGIRATLTADYIPSAYTQRPALILASAESQAAAAIFALQSLNIGPIYTIGFKATSSFAAAAGVHHFRGVEDMMRVEEPFVIISALPAEKSFVVAPLLKHYSSVRSGRKANPNQRPGKVFVDLSNGVKKGDPIAVAASFGWAAYGVADVNAWTAVETLRLMVGQNVPFDFVRLASGRSLYA